MLVPAFVVVVVVDDLDIFFNDMSSFFFCRCCCLDTKQWPALHVFQHRGMEPLPLPVGGDGQRLLLQGGELRLILHAIGGASPHPSGKYSSTI